MLGGPKDIRLGFVKAVLNAASISTSNPCAIVFTISISCCFYCKVSFSVGRIFID